MAFEGSVTLNLFGQEGPPSLALEQLASFACKCKTETEACRCLFAVSVCISLDPKTFCVFFSSQGAFNAAHPLLQVSCWESSSHPGDRLLGTALRFVHVALPPHRSPILSREASPTWCLGGNSPPPTAVSVMAVLSSPECCALASLRRSSQSAPAL